MSKISKDSDDLIVRIPASVLSSSENSTAYSSSPISFDVASKLGVRVVTGIRAAMRKPVQIQTIEIPKEAQRKRVLSLLQNDALYACMPEIYNYMYELGINSDDERRHFSAMCVARFASYFPFSELNEFIIEKWAKAEAATGSRESVALALISILAQGKYEHDILFLLDEWSKSSNLRLVATAIYSFYQFSNEYPNETLQAVKNIVLAKSTLFLHSRTSQLLEQVYSHHPQTVMDELDLWFAQEANSSLREFAAFSFHRFAKLEKFSIDEQECLQTAKFVFRLWENRLHQKKLHVQQQTTELIYEWAQATLQAPVDSFERMRYLTFFKHLDNEYTEQKQNRLRAHIKNWQSTNDAMLARLSSTSSDSEKAKYNLDYSQLIMQ